MKSYIDEKRRCSSCGESYVYSASDQRYRYEILGLPVGKAPSVCPQCRMMQRRPSALNTRLSTTAATARERPDDPDALLAWIEAAVALHEETARGDLNAPIAGARRVLRLDPDRYVAHYWQGRLHERLGRVDAALAEYQRFVDACLETPRRKTDRPLRRDAQRRAAELRHR